MQATVVYHTDRQLNSHANNIIEFIYKCEGKLHDYFQNRKSAHVHEMRTIIISFTIRIQTPGNILTMQHKLQMLCFNQENETFSVKI